MHSQTTRRIAAIACCAVLISGCSPDVRDPVTTTQTGTTDGGPTNGNGSGTSTEAASNGLFTLKLASGSINVVEGRNTNVDLVIERSNGHSLPITLAAAGQSDADAQNLYWNFTDEKITGDDTNTTITVGLNIGTLPIRSHNRSLRVIGTDGNSPAIDVILNLQITPTSRPDVYLLIGQSNMVGFSLDGEKQTGPGQADEPEDRIQQLNVTGNDGTNFNTTSAFTNVNRIAAPSPRLTLAIDPLHDGFDFQAGGKDGTRVGLGLSFAKRALQDTDASIFLVPAAWADTGFCTRTRELYQGQLGWNSSSAAAANNPALSGTLLHDRAIARTNLALSETGGILRGILWHQGEADSENRACADAYRENLRLMVESMRSKINQDARGAGARGINANIPFVLATMSKGRGYAELSDIKQIVDNAHRDISNIVPFSAYVNADNLVPPAYECGNGDCIHFGALALRELGPLYYDFLRQAALQ